MSFFMPTSKDESLPRTIPVFACCAMQASYAMIMLCFKTRAMGFVPGEGSPVDGMSGNGAAGRLLAQLGEGVGFILDALGNYGRAYEGLGGMRGWFFFQFSLKF